MDCQTYSATQRKEMQFIQCGEYFRWVIKNQCLQWVNYNWFFDRVCEWVSAVSDVKG
jgi:hypothetical protein